MHQIRSSSYEVLDTDVSWRLAPSSGKSAAAGLVAVARSAATAKRPATMATSRLGAEKKLAFMIILLWARIGPAERRRAGGLTPQNTRDFCRLLLRPRQSDP